MNNASDGVNEEHGGAKTVERIGHSCGEAAIQIRVHASVDRSREGVFWKSRLEPRSVMPPFGMRKRFTSGGSSKAMTLATWSE